MRALRAGLVSGALCAGCAASATASTEDATVRDAALPDRSCTGRVGPSAVEDIDPVTGCPGLVRVDHTVAAPGACVRIEPRCTIGADCRFDVALTVRSTVCSAARRPVFAACRCEFGVVECPGEVDGFGTWPGCTNNNLLCDPCGR